jgi:hypothetical protein
VFVPGAIAYGVDLLLLDPSGNISEVEPDEVAHLHIRETLLGNESANVADTC